MTLADAVRSARDGAVGRLDRLSLYWLDSRFVWRAHRALVVRGTVRQALRDEVAATSSDSTAGKLVETLSAAAGRADDYLLTELPSFVIQRLASIHEEFLAGIVRAWLLAKPAHLIQDESTEERRVRNKGPEERTVPFRRVLESSREELVVDAVNNAVEDLTRASVQDQYDRLRKFTKTARDLNHAEDEKLIVELAETRNALIHAQGVAGAIYIDKVAAELRRVSAAGERLPLPETYVAEAFELIRRAVARVADIVVTKAGAARG